jgi:hypothetical protein
MNGRFRRRSLVSALFVAGAVLVLSVSQGTAGVPSHSVTVPIEKANDGCPFTGNKKVIGHATFTRLKSGAVMVTYVLTGAVPTRTYEIASFYASSPVPDCNSPAGAGPFGKFKVDASGNARKTFIVPDMGGYNDFQVEGWNEAQGHYDLTDVAHL